MPIYEYECESCGNQFEIIQKITDEPLESCPECGGHVHKLISQTSFILKGSGWYVTDYASPERKKASQSEGSPEAKSEMKGETKNDTKAESKAESKAEVASQS